MPTTYINRLPQSPNDLLLLIQSILECTGLFLFERSLLQLHTFLAGFRRCADLNGVRLDNDGILNEFNAYLITKYRHSVNSSFGWFDFFAAMDIPDLERFEAFREYFQEFLRVRDV